MLGIFLDPKKNQQKVLIALFLLSYHVVVLRLVELFGLLPSLDHAGREKQEVFPEASTDGITASRKTNALHAPSRLRRPIFARSTYALRTVFALL
jgi:hypothetical protein